MTAHVYLRSACYFQQLVRVKDKELKVAMRAMFFLLTENIAFVKFGKLLDVFSEFGVTTPVANLPSNANMRGEVIKADIVAALGGSVKSSVLSDLHKSPCYSIMIDETMDIRTVEQMVIYVKYITVTKGVAVRNTR